MKRTLSLTLSAIVTALTVACLTSPPFNSDGIPDSKYLVGGGLEIEYTAPSDGTAYWVDETTAKIITTESVAEGDTFDVGDVDVQQMETTLGIAIHEAKFMLYFVPKKPKE
jgi:hypothetical protein